MSTPHVPPRPQRNSAKNEMPVIPPRPVRKTDPSPDRGTRSPLNFPPTSMGSKPQPRSGRNSEELPRRPPSVSLPDLGHEGDEYSSFDQLPAEAHGVKVVSGEEATSNVSADLPMHQPRASVPQSTAKRQIHTVTSTDSTQAAAAGIGRARPADDVHKLPPQDGTTSPMRRVTSNEPRRPPSTDHHLRAKASFNRSSTSLNPLERTTSRPGSIHGGDDFEHGIPEIGQQIPLNRWAGDAQAPSPATAMPQHAPGIGFFNDGSSKNHHRKRSSRHEFGPPDSYGIRHDQDRQDQFEQEWIRKHPQEAVKENYHHQHLPKPETALSSDQLNRLIHGNDSLTAAGTPGTPDEDDAIELAEEYQSRVGTPQNAGERKKRASSGEATSPRHRGGFPFADKNRLRPEDALEDEPQPSPRRRSRITDDYEHEHADGTPILASDELLKRPSSAFMHAAVDYEPHGDDFYDSDHSQTARRNSSRPSSRPSSVHGSAAMNYTGGSLHRYVSHEEQHHSGVGTPLEEIEEYEPLFPEDEKESDIRKKVLKKRPDLAHHHFPSQDVWEDSPASLHYSTEVSTPELERKQVVAEPASSTSTSTFETPEQEAKRRDQNPNDMTSDSKTFMKPHFKAGVMHDLHERPSAHRFPSSDVWEDSPDSVRLETTVGGPQEDEITSPSDDRPAVPSRPQRSSRLTQEVKPSELEPNQARSPDKSKPAVPARPARNSQSNQSRSIDETVTSPPVPKAKPAVPARPAGEKLASMKAGFMNDLNNRLKLGPQGPPPKKEAESDADEETERAPLADARKGRAKGPARRKPAAAPVADRKASLTFAMSPLITVWTIDEEDEVQVNDKENKENQEPSTKIEEAEKTLNLNDLENTDAAAPSMPPLTPQELATTISNSERPGTAAGEHLASQAELEAALAAAGAGPAQYEGRDEKIEEKDTAVQTGETELKTTLPSGEKETHVAYVGSKAAEEGDVVVKQADELTTS